jgi:hypothetical protein
MIHVQCRSCYSTLALKDIYAGKLARCPICQNKVRVPKQEEEAEDEAREERVSAAPKARAPAESRRPSRRPVREEEDEEERPVRPKRRPIEEDDRSEDIQEKRPARSSRTPIEEEEEDDDDVQLEVVEEPPPRKRRKKKRRRRRRPESAGWEMPDVNWFYIGLAVVAFIWLVSVPLAFAFPPIMIVPVGLGCLLAFAGYIWFLIIAFQDEVIHGILCLLLNIYCLYYLILNFEETKFPFLVWALGLFMMGSGLCAGGAFSHGK